jgi:hypothetical protein
LKPGECEGTGQKLVNLLGFNQEKVYWFVYKGKEVAVGGNGVRVVDVGNEGLMME